MPQSIHWLVPMSSAMPGLSWRPYFCLIRTLKGQVDWGLLPTQSHPGWEMSQGANPFLCHSRQAGGTADCPILLEKVFSLCGHLGIIGHFPSWKYFMNGIFFFPQSAILPPYCLEWLRESLSTHFSARWYWVANTIPRTSVNLTFNCVDAERMKLLRQGRYCRTHGNESMGSLSHSPRSTEGSNTKNFSRRFWGCCAAIGSHFELPGPLGLKFWSLWFKFCLKWMLIII